MILLTEHSKPGVNNRLPYSAKSWQRSVSNFLKTHRGSKRRRESTPPESDGSVTPPDELQQYLGDLKAVITKQWGEDVQTWLPAELPYPPEYMSSDKLHKWPPGVVAALSELAQAVGSDSEKREEALDHMATAVAVRRSLSRKMKTGGEWVACTDVEYATAKMNGQATSATTSATASYGAPPQLPSDVQRAGEARSGAFTEEFMWVNNNWEGNLNQSRPDKKRRFDPELGSEEGSVCSNSEIPSGVEFESFRLKKRNAALKARNAELKQEIAMAHGQVDAERMRREDAESFMSTIRTSMSKYLGEPKLEDPEEYISDTRNALSSYLRDAEKRQEFL
ncbi:uncharacterized protein BKCO1_3600097 [Diplodia corticola]|uniref:Uncharacterized protein n=1 Tax=Diplodia corticola TaxID=236234 RepID=A0A1J9QXN8_9PEZI|nr:uncharacterized protein BKCO1_3600097 [Diplodia corticola]OJD32746.1 hypothetical protein BKCO1_3600097 [Diplodia corticola]